MVAITECLAEAIWNETKDLPSTPARVSQQSFALPVTGAATIAPVQNILTVLGDSVPNSGVPCFQCVTNGMGNTLGLVTPDASVHADGVTLYAFDNYLFDNSDTESCNYTFLVKDAAAKYILKLGPFALALTSSTAYITSISATLPKDPAAVGAGTAITLVQCGSTKTTSSMAMFINYP